MCEGKIAGKVDSMPVGRLTIYSRKPMKVTETSASYMIHQQPRWTPSEKRSRELVQLPACASTSRGHGLFKRSSAPAFAAFLVLVLYTLAVQPISMLNPESLLVLVLTAACIVVAEAMAAAIVRKRPVAMVLLAHAFITILVGVIWQR
jgi:hypothetical protein